jgi:hypothetical protein
VGSVANGGFATAMGVGSIANGAFATAMGMGSVANGATATAIGQDSLAQGDATTALGQGSRATGPGSTALGAGADTRGFANSTAIGAGATNTAANQMMFGTASTIYAAPGITSAASRAAQSGPTQFVTSDASGNLATSNFGPQDIAGLKQDMTGLKQDVTGLKQDMLKSFEGTAIAIALSGSALPSDKRFAISTNWGNFRGQNAMSFAGQMRLNEAIVVNAGIAAGLQHSGIGSRVGATLAW